MLRGLQDNQEDEYQARRKTHGEIRPQLYDIRCRFVFLNDDFGAGSRELVVRLINGLNKRICESKRL